MGVHNGKGSEPALDGAGVPGRVSFAELVLELGR